MTFPVKPAPLKSQVLQIVLLAGLLAFAYNSFSIKKIPLVRQEAMKVAVSDSELFHGQKSPVRDTGKSHPDTQGVKVIAPLHDSALAHADSARPAPPVEEKKDSYRIITLSQLNRLLAAGHYLLLDARDTAAYRKGHIKGARNMFGLATDQYFPDLAPMARDTLTLIYCNNPDCHLGRMLGDFMHAIGFTNLYLYDDGWDGWEKAGMPIDSSQTGGP